MDDNNLRKQIQKAEELAKLLNNGSKEPLLTNEKWFSGMHTEAKAEWLADHMKCSKCPQQNRCNGYHGGCVALILEWLKEKHNGTL